jgi:hypothetical protein
MQRSDQLQQPLALSLRFGARSVECHPRWVTEPLPDIFENPSAPTRYLSKFIAILAESNGRLPEDFDIERLDRASRLDGDEGRRARFELETARRAINTWFTDSSIDQLVQQRHLPPFGLVSIPKDKLSVHPTADVTDIDSWLDRQTPFTRWDLERWQSPVPVLASMLDGALTIANFRAALSMARDTHQRATFAAFASAENNVRRDRPTFQQVLHEDDFSLAHRGPQTGGFLFALNALALTEVVPHVDGIDRRLPANETSRLQFIARAAFNSFPIISAHTGHADASIGFNALQTYHNYRGPTEWQSDAFEAATSGPNVFVKPRTPRSRMHWPAYEYSPYGDIIWDANLAKINEVIGDLDSPRTACPLNQPTRIVATDSRTVVNSPLRRLFTYIVNIGVVAITSGREQFDSNCWLVPHGPNGLRMESVLRAQLEPAPRSRTTAAGR